jgi:origin recognition complex subunit 3
MELAHLLSDLMSELDTLTKAHASQKKPFRSEHSLRHETLRTTVVAQKVELSRQKSTLSKQDAAYSKLVCRFHDELRIYFEKNLINPYNLFLHEVLVYELKSPHRDAFTPKPRFAIERALTLPRDYLGCNCCVASESALSSSQPPTAILYQLYLESGASINALDLWSAFYAVVGGEDGEDCDERNAL